MTKTPIPTENSKKNRYNSQKTPPKSSITKRLRTDLGRSVGLNMLFFLNINRLLNVTFDDILVIIYVTAHRCAGWLKKLNLRPGSHAIEISEGSIKYPSKHRHAGSPCYGMNCRPAWIVAGDNSCRCSQHKSSLATIHADVRVMNCRRHELSTAWIVARRQFMPMFAA